MALALHSCSLSSDHHEMLSNNDMKMIRSVNSSGSTLIVDWNSWTSLQSCNVVNLGKLFHSNSSGSPSILCKFMYSDQLMNHVNLSSQTI